MAVEALRQDDRYWLTLSELCFRYPKFRLRSKFTTRWMIWIYHAALMFWWYPEFLATEVTLIGNTLYVPGTWVTGSPGAADVLQSVLWHFDRRSGRR